MRSTDEVGVRRRRVPGAHVSGDVDLADPGSYGTWITERVRFSDTDAMGHVNNVAIAAYVESGRVAYGMGLAADRSGSGGLPGFILARLAIDYRAELHYPGEVRVGSRVVAVGRTSYTVGSGVFDRDRCVATAEGVLVMIGDDGPAPIVGAFRDALEREAAGA